jgi:Tfp pilus assembly protein PilX
MKIPTIVKSSSAIRPFDQLRVVPSSVEERQAHGAPSLRRGERGIALVVVLLLMAVLSGLATGFAMNGNIEVQMGTNEVYYAGARAAAEAGLNRAIVEIIANTNTNFLAGTDGLVDAGNAAAAVNADNGSLAFLLGGAGPYALDAAGEYTYDIEVVDDDDDSIYATALTAAQVTQMGEDDSPFTNINDRLILRATGFGPNGTTVRLARVLETVDTTTITSTTTTTLSNPALLVNGNLEMNGGVEITGTDSTNAAAGTVHANGNMVQTGSSPVISGSATASGTWTQAGNFTAGGEQGGGRPTINVPDIQASNYQSLADFKLTSSGGIQTMVGGAWTDCSTAQCNNALASWSYSAGSNTWNSSNNPTSARYFIDGNVDIGTTQGSSNRAVSVFATGDINIHGNAKLQPHSQANAIQFVCDGDLKIVNTSDLDAVNFGDGQIMVRGQFEGGGSIEFQGRILVQDVAGAGNLVDYNRIHGNAKFRYAGTLGSLSTTTVVTTTGPTTYVNNVSGWMEQ